MDRELAEVSCHCCNSGVEACLAEARSLRAALRQSPLVDVACNSILGEHRAVTVEAMA